MFDSSFSYVALNIVLCDDSEPYPLGSDSVETEPLSDSDGGSLFGGCFLEGDEMLSMSSIHTEDFRVLLFEVASDDFFDDFDLDLAAESLFWGFLTWRFRTSR